MNAEQAEPWVTREELAKALHLSDKTIKRWEEAGVGFPSYPVGPRQNRYSVTEAKTWVRDNPDKVKALAVTRSLKAPPRKKKE